MFHIKLATLTKSGADAGFSSGLGRLGFYRARPTPNWPIGVAPEVQVRRYLFTNKPSTHDDFKAKLIEGGALTIFLVGRYVGMGC